MCSFLILPLLIHCHEAFLFLGDIVFEGCWAILVAFGNTCLTDTVSHFCFFLIFEMCIHTLELAWPF